MTGTSQITVLDPSFRAQASKKTQRRLAPRTASLDGAKITFIINGLGYSERLARMISERMADLAKIDDFIFVVKSGVAVPPDPADWQAILDNANGVVSLFGGCGSCSTRSFRDAVEAEWAGIPAVPIIHDAVLGGVKTLAKILAMTDYPIVLMKPPYHNACTWTDQEMNDAADMLAPQIIDRLTADASIASVPRAA